MPGHNTYKGKFHPKFPKKYKGDITNIIYRSLWERSVMRKLDENPNVLLWMSEELIVPYISPKDGKLHRYFPDFLVKVKTKDNKIKVSMIEVKPYKETIPPKPPKTKRGKGPQRFLEESVTYAVNHAKWKAAVQYCEKNNWEFKIMTEKQIL